MRKESLINFVLLGGFLMMLLEIRVMHLYELKDHWQTWIPLFYCVLAMAACFMSGSKNFKLARVAVWIFALGLVVGPLGLYFHLDGSLEPLKPLLGMGEPDGGAPPLAPLGLAGLATIGLITSWPKKGEELARA
jgi:hypothetical protein